MNRKYIVSIGVVVSMMSSIASAGYMYDNLDNSLGDTLTNRGNWRATSASVVIATNNAGVNNKGNAAKIPILQTLSNLVNLADTETNVWTDFWTIPRPFVSAVDAAPAVDPNSSAMFFVTNSFWAVVHGSGGSATNVCVSNVFNTAAIDPVMNDGSSWRRISVYHKYGDAKNWSFFVDGRPVKVNMAFIDPNVLNYQWFSVQNGGGNASNVTWIDDVLITNRVPASMADDDGDTMSDAWELMYFGDFSTAVATADTDGDGFNNSQESILGGNPAVQSPSEPGGSNMMEYVFNAQDAGIVSLETNGASATAMKLTFSVGANRTYIVMGSTSPNGPFNQYVGSFDTDLANSLVDEDALTRNNYYYRLLGTNDGVTALLDETYVFHVQPRATVGSSNFWVGVMVDYGANSRLDSTLGTQLAQGLQDRDILSVYLGGGQTMFELENGVWGRSGGAFIDVDTHIPIGTGMLIKRPFGNLSANDKTVFSGAMITSNTISLGLKSGWNMITWPFEGSNVINAANSGLLTADNANDYMWIYRNGSYYQLRKPISGYWRLSGGGTLPASAQYLKFGDGVFYSKTGADSSWNPTNSVP